MKQTLRCQITSRVETIGFAIRLSASSSEHDILEPELIDMLRKKRQTIAEQTQDMTSELDLNMPSDTWLGFIWMINLEVEEN